MPHFSRFTPYGHLRFSSKKPIGESIFVSMVKSYGEPNENISDNKDSDVQIRIYATAMALARWQNNLEHAGNQYLPFKADELLPTLEKDYGIRPSADATDHERRTVLARRMRKPLGASISALTASLSEAIGADFVTVHTVPETGPDAQVTVPAAAEAGEAGANLQVVEATPIKLGRITEVVSTAAGLVLNFTHIGGDLTGAMAPGSAIVIAPGLVGLQEFVRLDTSQAVTINADGSGSFKLGTRPYPIHHGTGAYFTTGRFPYLLSTRRELIVVLTTAGTQDQETREVVHEVMSRNARATDVWAIVEEVSPGTIGPFRIGVSPLGSTPLGAIGI